MILDSVVSSFVGSDGSTVTFDFTCNARLAASEETAVDWALNVEWTSHGMTAQRGNLPPLPMIKAGSVVVSPGQAPRARASQGDNWRPTFRHRFTKAEILVDNNDVYIFNTALVPLVDINSSNPRSHVLQTDID